MSETSGRRAAADGTLFRRLASAEDYAACLELQRRTWGRRFRELVPPSVIKVSQRVGGVAAGAFDSGGRLLGFVFGLSGVRRPAGPDAAALPAEPSRPSKPSRPSEASEPSEAEPPQIVHWSHMLAVAPEARDRGLGTRLKLYQRELLLPLGVEVVEWTYDPLEARNAHLNLNHLGGEVAEYVEDMYRGEMGSELARGIGTDRFIVAWRIAGDHVAAALSAAPAAGAIAEHYAAAPVVDLAGMPAGSRRPAVWPSLPAASRVRVEVPPDIQTLKAAQPEQARQWRLLEWPAVWDRHVGHREPASRRCFYCLAEPSEPAGRSGAP